MQTSQLAPLLMGASCGASCRWFLDSRWLIRRPVCVYMRARVCVACVYVLRACVYMCICVCMSLLTGIFLDSNLYRIGKKRKKKNYAGRETSEGALLATLKNWQSP